jgi:hypothetical protein
VGFYLARVSHYETVVLALSNPFDQFVVILLDINKIILSYLVLFQGVLLVHGVYAK